MTRTKVLLLVVAVLAAMLIAQHAYASQLRSAEDGSVVPDSFYENTCTYYAVAYTEQGQWGSARDVGSGEEALEMQDGLEGNDWDSTIAFTYDLPC